LKPTIVMVALLAAVIVVAVGAGFYLLNGSKSAWNASDASVATFVGNETCAGCRRAETEFPRFFLLRCGHGLVCHQSLHARRAEPASGHGPV
jgi:hypothetical protein